MYSVRKNMYSARSNNLFREQRLDDYLRSRLQTISSEIDRLTPEQIAAEENVIGNKLLEKHGLEVPTLNEGAIQIDAHEAQIAVRGNSRIHSFGDGTSLVKGLEISVTVPFDGDSKLFHYMPSTYSLSGTPDAQIFENRLVLSYETAEKDPEKIKQLWARDISDIKQNLEWISRDIAANNALLQNSMASLVSRRKQEAGEYKSIIDQLKQS